MMLKPKILLVDDDCRFIQLFIANLMNYFDFIHADTFEKAQTLVQQNYFDAVVLDLNFKGKQTGKDYFLELRKVFKNPVFILSTDESYQTKLELLKLGIDDYLWKTMTDEEIYFRINNTLKNRTPPNFYTNISIGNLVFNSVQMLATIKDAKIELTKNESKILYEICNNETHKIHKSELITKVWLNQQINEGTFSTALYQLNKKLLLWDYKISTQKEIVQIIKR